MLIELTGNVRPEDLSKIIAPIAALLAEQGVAKMNSIKLNFLAWGVSGERRQLVGSDGHITSLAFDAESIAATLALKFKMPDTLSFRDRPDDMDVSMFAVGARHDD